MKQNQFKSDFAEWSSNEAKKPTQATSEIDAKIKATKEYQDAVKEAQKTEEEWNSQGYGKYGNIDNFHRDKIDWTEENLAKYKDFVDEQNSIFPGTIEKGSYSTVLGSWDTISDEDGTEHPFAFTPMLQTDSGLVPLTEDQLWNYIDTIVEQCYDENGKLDIDKLMELDATGLDEDINGVMMRVKGMIAGVADGKNQNGGVYSAADILALSGDSNEDIKNDLIDLYGPDADLTPVDDNGNLSRYVGKSMHDAQAVAQEGKDNIETVYNQLYNDLENGSSGESDGNSSAPVRYVDHIKSAFETLADSLGKNSGEMTVSDVVGLSQAGVQLTDEQAQALDTLTAAANKYDTTIQGVAEAGEENGLFGGIESSQNGIAAAAQQMDTISKKIDEIQSAYKACTTAMDEYRSNADSSSASLAAEWLVRKGLSADTVQAAIKTDKTNGAYCDAFYKSSGTYMGVTIRAIASGGRATLGRTWTLVNSNEVNGTTATDKKTSSECWKTVADAGNELHKQAYSVSAPAKDEGYVASAGSANTSSSCAGNSASATKLTSSAGSATQPVYFKDGKPVAGTYTLGDASSKMVRTLSAQGNSGWANQTTDDKYVPTMSFMAYWNGAYGGTSSNLQYCDRGRFGTIVTKNSGDYAAASHTHDDRYYTESEMNSKLGGKVDNTEAGCNALMTKLGIWTAVATDDTYFIRQDIAGGASFGRVKFSTLWSYIKSKSDSTYQAKGSYAAASHTHNYAGSGSAGGSANSAAKLDTATAGSTTQPVYFSGGKPVAIGYTIAKSVPADAKFTDTNTWRGIQNNLISDSTDQSLSAAQGKALKTLVDGKAPTSHTHTKSQITDFPTSMPASDVYAWAKAATKPSYTKAEVGLSNVDNTAAKDKSVKYAETAGTAEKAVAADNGIAAFNVNNTSTMPTGYIRFNNGIQICWGKTYSGNTSGSFTYPQSFSGLPSVMISGTGAYRYAFYVTKFTKTGFEYYRDGSGDTAKPQYIAIGSWEQS